MNNALAQAMIAKRVGCHLVTATGSGQHGLATAAACAKLALQCTIFMASKDKDRQSSKVRLIKLLGAQSFLSEHEDEHKKLLGKFLGYYSNMFSSGTTSMFDHGSQVSVDDRERNKDSSIGKMGKEARDVLVTCVGIGSNAIGLFHEFIAHSDVRLIRVETGGLGLESGRHSSKLTMGEVGIYHGSMSYLLQDDDGQVIEPHSIIVG
ncbi:Tryptophan synthase beta chain 2, chloroplastic [Glycine soja]|uniref:tryptophan synthase n=1 Tax=Glycine soja TaxID=3848 RepID=A0A0B2R5Y2_GLYSO|nr:Tryptophan synthase beta chain 2, chloroplastic [Glycine soja]